MEQAKACPTRLLPLLRQNFRIFAYSTYCYYHFHFISRMKSRISTLFFAIVLSSLAAFSAHAQTDSAKSAAAPAAAVAQQPAPPPPVAAPAPEAGGEASLVLPDLGSVQFLGMSGHNLLL